MNFKIVKGNIIDAKVDAIVLPANSKLKERSGASRAIFEAAGRKALTQKCKELKYCEVGSAVPTLGYDLDCKTIIHAVVPKWIDGNHDEYNLLSAAYVSSLELADVMGCKSIAFPLLASGNNKFDFELAFEIAIKNFEAFKPEALEEVLLVVYSINAQEYAKNEGYEVSILPRNLEKDAAEQLENEKREKQKEEFKENAKRFTEEQLQKGKDYLKKPENREKAIKVAIDIVKIAVLLVNKAKK